MREAIKAVQENKMRTTKASKMYDLSRINLRQRVEERNIDAMC